GGARQRQPLTDDLARVPDRPQDDLLALDEALARLATKDALKAQLVELRFFAGLTGAQAAAVLGISPSSADRHWTFARAWLRRELGADFSSEEDSSCKSN
ncbi:MAG TPA: ECF-type sigma factor, partial [Gemmatales bacterium]|nr:ECF-type sigma factor [Gemmatales bacterium]